MAPGVARRKRRCWRLASLFSLNASPGSERLCQGWMDGRRLSSLADNETYSPPPPADAIPGHTGEASCPLLSPTIGADAAAFRAGAVRSPMRFLSYTSSLLLASIPGGKRSRWLRKEGFLHRLVLPGSIPSVPPALLLILPKTRPAMPSTHTTQPHRRLMGANRGLKLLLWTRHACTLLYTVDLGSRATAGAEARFKLWLGLAGR